MAVKLDILRGIGRQCARIFGIAAVSCCACTQQVTTVDPGPSAPAAPAQEEAPLPMAAPAEENQAAESVPQVEQAGGASEPSEEVSAKLRESLEILKNLKSEADIEILRDMISERFTFLLGGKKEFIEIISSSLDDGGELDLDAIEITVSGGKAEVRNVISYGDDGIIDQFTLLFEKEQGNWLITAIQFESNPEIVLEQGPPPVASPAPGAITGTGFLAGLTVSYGLNSGMASLDADVEDPMAMYQPITDPQY